MASGPYSFIDIAVLEEVRARFAAGDALAILTPELDEVVWANGAGAALLGYSDIEAIMGESPGLSLPARRQISAAPGFPRTVRNRTLAVRLASGLKSRTVAIQVNSLTLPRGEQAVLLAVPNDLEPDGNGARRSVEGFREAGYYAALVDGDAAVTASSEGFQNLGISDDTLNRLVAEVAHEHDRLVKRLIPALEGKIPAGIARLTDRPRLHLLVAIPDVVPVAEEQPEDTGPAVEQEVEQAAPPETAQMEVLPEPSESDLVERIEEDASAMADAYGDETETDEAEDATVGETAEVETESEEQPDTWYFSGGDSEPADEPAEQPHASVRDFSKITPIRFAWRTDADGHLSFLSTEFLAAIGNTANFVGRPFREIAEELRLDPDGDIVALLDHRDTWSGKTVQWPIEGTGMVAPVDLAALPAYSRDRTFEGFRGFGVLRLSEAHPDPFLRHKPETQPATPVDTAPVEPQKEDDPFQGETPVLAIVETPERRKSDKVIRLAERRPAAQDETKASTLSPGERNAFEEIRARLRRDYDLAQADAKAADTTSATADEQATAVDPGDETPQALTTAADVADDETEFEPQRDIEEQKAEPDADSYDEEDPALPPNTGPTQQSVHEDLISGLPLPVLIHAGDELYFANREFLSLTGYASLDQIRREGGLDRLFVDSDPHDDDLDDPRPFLRTLGGDEFPVEAHLQSIRWNDRSALLLSVRKIEPSAEPQPAEPEAVEVVAPTAEIAEMERRVAEMRTIIDTATDGVVLISDDGTIRSISNPAEALFGFNSADVEGKPFHSLFAIESQKAAQHYLEGLSGNGVASVLNDGREVIGREAEGRFIPLFMTIGRLPGDSGYCAVVRDLTQWKRAEEELTQARSQAERSSSQKTEFLARVSHEIRTPLNAIIGFSELMMDEKFGPIGSDRYRDYLRDINRSGNHVLDLVNDLLDISKIEAGEQEMNYEAVSLNDSLAECVAMMQPQANRERVIIRSSLASRLPEVVADLRSVRQIALNLLSNAIRYTQAGGQVIVSTSYEASGDVIMRFRDTGIGMTLSEIDQALKPFKQINALKRGRHDGTGLGLPLTKAMVEANRARFTIASTPGEGTLVEVAFPSTRVLAD